MKDSCKSCLLKSNNNIVYPEGDINSKIIIVGESPSHEEVKRGKPFVGPSGRILRKVLNDFEVVPYITNVIKFQSSSIERDMETCLPCFLEEMEQVPLDSTIVLLGGTARDALLPHLKKLGVLQTRGWHTWNNRNVFCTIHPAYVLRNRTQFLTLLKDIKKVVNGKIPDIVVNYTLVEREELLLGLIEQISHHKVCAYDIETNARGEILCVSLSFGEHAFVLTRECLNVDALNQLFGLSTKFVGHNVMYDVSYLYFEGVNARYDDDTLLMHYFLDENSPHGLKELSKEFLDFSYGSEVDGQKDFGNIEKSVLYKYSATDAIVTLKLYNIFRDALIRKGLMDSYSRCILTPLPLIMRMHLKGIRVDVNALEMAKNEMNTFLKSVSQRLLGVNPNSPKQVSSILFDKYNCPQVLGRSTSAEALDNIVELLKKVPNNETINEVLDFISAVQEHRRVGKMLSSYINTIQQYLRNGRVHPWWRLWGTETGRLSARDPAIQTIPRSSDKWGKLVRDLFIPDEGYTMVYADYSQMELRVAAALSNDPFMVRVFKDNRDFHGEVATKLFGQNYTQDQRVLTKHIVFSWLYGGDVKKYLIEWGKYPEKDAEELRNTWNSTFTVFIEWREEQVRNMLSRGYIETFFGRRRRFPVITVENRHEATFSAMNTPVQSAASDVMLNAAVRLMNDHPEMDILILVHDSIICQMKEPRPDVVSEYLVHTAEEFFPNVPFKVDVKVIERWGDA